MLSYSDLGPDPILYRHLHGMQMSRASLYHTGSLSWPSCAWAFCTHLHLQLHSKSISALVKRGLLENQGQFYLPCTSLFPEEAWRVKLGRVVGRVAAPVCFQFIRARLLPQPFLVWLPTSHTGQFHLMQEQWCPWHSTPEKLLWYCSWELLA